MNFAISFNLMPNRHKSAEQSPLDRSTLEYKPNEMTNPPRPGRADRSSNTQTVLDILRSKGPLTQADIARASALSRATVNNIVQALRDQGTVEYQWKNRREALVTLSSTRGSILTITVHERRASASLFDFSGQERIDRSSDETSQEQATSPAQVLALARDMIALANARRSAVTGIAIAMEGPIETSTGAIAPWAWQRLPHWKGVDIHQTLSRQLRLPLVVDNDANLAALAEWSWGEGRGCNDFLHITCSEGIGGGIVLNGKIYRGGSGLAGEIGHMVIADTGDLCFCGSRGCLSSFATERAILNALRNADNPKPSLAAVVESAAHGDAACQRILFEAGTHLGQALATVVRVISPSVIAIGGTLGMAGEIVLDGLRSAAEITNLRAVGAPPRFCIARFTQGAVELGGVASVLSLLDHGASAVAPWMLAGQPGMTELSSPQA